MNSKFVFLSLFLILFISCSKQVEDAQSIVDKSINAHGGKLYENSKVEFDFRGRHYIIERNQGLYTYHRIFEDSLGNYHDILSNDGFKRLLNDIRVSVDGSWAERYSSSINSVAYFAYLPFGLNDPAVNKNLVGEEELNGDFYYKIQVTFNQEDGGEDYDDVFVYWINKENYLMEYFGYSYKTDNGGIRFRKAVNMQHKNGLIFSDYINFAGSADNRDVSGLAELFEAGKLKKLSEIKIENLKVIPNN